ncbi:PssD/Cps14F family polysaccharide biosynthesis glycosyltransferase [Grimontia sp. SpTr1]|uniref:PssD/Cps14F family polysaccharide biosynthesis glycosyltransferase n=1 Tax=Grimontia sp. SpTr1 TaxID=2995319 RepID=UPI00248B75F0|nr:PssD/Cps14F family polysaccharide biosynthesis glycosyltransferase [Grimontia sp. SpTr1]
MAQLKRLYQILEVDQNWDSLIVTDVIKQTSSSPFLHNVVDVGFARNKTGFSLPSFLRHILRVSRISMLILFSRKACVISTGPGISILPSILVRLRGGKVIHVETWSRFSSQSLTGKYMKYIATDFYVQNESLLNVYPKAKFSGRL